MQIQMLNGERHRQAPSLEGVPDSLPNPAANEHDVSGGACPVAHLVGDAEISVAINQYRYRGLTQNPLYVLGGATKHVNQPLGGDVIAQAKLNKISKRILLAEIFELNSPH